MGCVCCGMSVLVYFVWIEVYGAVYVCFIGVGVSMGGFTVGQGG